MAARVRWIFTPWLQKLADADYSRYLAVFLHGHTLPDDIEPRVAKSREYLLKCRKNVRPGGPERA